MVLFHYYLLWELISTIERDSIEKPQSNVTKNLNKQPIDPVALFFKSKGVLVFSGRNENLNKSITILNEDNTVFAIFNDSSDVIVIKGQKYSLRDFSNNEKLMQQYNFFPKAFYPDNTVIQFEYLAIKNGVAVVYLDKKNNIKKRIKLEGNSFEIEPWKEHFLGAMVGFDVKTNPIRIAKRSNAKSVGYENSKEEYIFIITEISGDWIKIECSDGLCGYPCKEGEKYDGWIKWKEGDKLLIQFSDGC